MFKTTTSKINTFFYCVVMNRFSEFCCFVPPNIIAFSVHIQLFLYCSLTIFTRTKHPGIPITFLLSIHFLTEQNKDLRGNCVKAADSTNSIEFIVVWCIVPECSYCC